MQITTTKLNRIMRQIKRILRADLTNGGVVLTRVTKTVANPKTMNVGNR
jgi:hypothetical protein